jgi:hypothetical protein
MATTLITVALAPRTKPEFPPKIWLENYGLYTTKLSCFASQSEAVVGLLPTEMEINGVRVVVDVPAADVIVIKIETVMVEIGTAPAVIATGAVAASALTGRSAPITVATARSAAACQRPRQMMRRLVCWSTTLRRVA